MSIVPAVIKQRDELIEGRAVTGESFHELVPSSATHIVLVLRPVRIPAPRAEPKPGVSRAAPNSALSILKPGLPPHL